MRSLFNFRNGYIVLQQPDSELSNSNKNARRIRAHYRALMLVNSIMFLFSLSVISIWINDKYFVLNSELRRTSTWSPIHNLIDLDMKPRLVQGTIFPADNASVARQMPNPAADAVWQEWEDARIIPITKSDVLKLGKDPKTAFKLEDSIWHLGEDMYGAHLDVYHQLHCLNTLREIAYGKYYNASTGNHEQEEIYEVHLNHCVDILMQALQCSGNVNLITLHWYETQPFPHPDFSINRQCVAFERLTRWNRENSIDRQRYLDLRVEKPKGQVMEPAPRRMLEWARKHVGEYDREHHHDHHHQVR